MNSIVVQKIRYSFSIIWILQLPDPEPELEPDGFLPSDLVRADSKFVRSGRNPVSSGRMSFSSGLVRFGRTGARLTDRFQLCPEHFSINLDGDPMIIKLQLVLVLARACQIQNFWNSTGSIDDGTSRRA
jgi:hypothetical protein